MKSLDKSPLVSVVVTSYNHADYLRERMDSLINQTYSNFEIIVIDDFSSDHSSEVLEEYSKYKNVSILILDKNYGYSHTSNLGIKLSNGKYIMFAECDDYSNKDQIKILMSNFFSRDNIGVVFSGSNMVDGNGKKYGEDIQWRNKHFRGLCNENRIIDSNLISRFFLESCVIPNLSAAIIKKNVLTAVNGFSTDFTASADWDMWCRVASTTDFYYVTEQLNNFRNHRTTVRNSVLQNKGGISHQISEILILLHNHLKRNRFNKFEKIKLHSRMGLMWVQFLIVSPRIWLVDFFSVSSIFYRYTFIWPIYLIYGFIARVKIMLLSKYKNLKKII